VIIVPYIDENFTNLGKKYWKEAGLDHKIDLRLGDATQTLQSLIDDPANVGSFDFAFIDADKTNYLTYYEQLLTLLKSGGFMMFDNTLWNGRIANPADRENDANTKHLWGLLQTMKADTRVEMHSLCIGDGLTIVTKK
jgi:predicted O-methyltransferase YrrM